MAASCKKLGLQMMDWYSSMGDPIYAAGSTLFSGRKIPRDLARRAASRLEANVSAARRREHGWTPEDAYNLRSMARRLRSKTCVL